MIPINQFGKDHWSMFALIAHWCAEAGLEGFDVWPKRRQLRIDPRRHLALAGWQGRNFPTTLREGVEISPHDDWDCVEDMEDAGLVDIKGTGLNPVVHITDKGLRLAAEVTAFKTRGGCFGEFVPS